MFTSSTQSVLCRSSSKMENAFETSTSLMTTPACETVLPRRKRAKAIRTASTEVITALKVFELLTSSCQ